jgi:peptidoglycan-N-acetylglucosamine deacetylase
MIGNESLSLRTRSSAILCVTLFVAFAAPAAAAEDCPGHPDAIGTSRTLVVDPHEHPRIGGMQYSETLPLHDHEVVLTFDDGPLPKYSNQVLNLLAAQCVKATFFAIGRQARANPEGVLKLAAAGHSIGTHSQNHPLTFQKMPIERAKQEIDDGIASVTAALGDPSAIAPFFRIPGLLRANGVEEYLGSRGIQVWSADFPADDWHHISPQRVYDTAMKRLESKGKGILLLHDIQARTVAALPKILRELKARGYRIVHVVPATADRPPTPTKPQEWQLHPTPETAPVAHWPAVSRPVFAEKKTLPIAALPNFDAAEGSLFLSAEPFARTKPLDGLPLSREAPWPKQIVLPVENTAATLPVPGKDVFAMPETADFASALRSGEQAPIGLGSSDHPSSSAERTGSRVRALAHVGRDTLRRMPRAKARPQLRVAGKNR